MLRFFFGTDDGVRRVHDTDGIVLACLTGIPAEPHDLLFDLGRAEILKGKPRYFTATMRDATGVAVYRGTVALDVEWES